MWVDSCRVADNHNQFEPRFITIVLTGLFLWPLFRSNLISTRIRRATLRTAIATFIGLTVSTINVGISVVEHGEESGWLCMCACTFDITCNVVALFWVTGGSAPPQPQSREPQVPGQKSSCAKPTFTDLTFADQTVLQDQNRATLFGKINVPMTRHVDWDISYSAEVDRSLAAISP
jgi:hypothetical protein